MFNNICDQFPVFPEKSIFSSWFQSIESKEELQEHLKAIQAYLAQINKMIIYKPDAINYFVCNTFDPERLKCLTFSKLSKEILYSNYRKSAQIKKCSFNKVFRVSLQQMALTIHQYLIPQSDFAKNEYENFKRAQLLITDFTYVVKCFEIGHIVKNKPFFNKKIKRTVYNKFIKMDDIQYDIIYAVEEWVEQPMNQIIFLRAQTHNLFQLDVIVEAIITLVSVAQYFQFLQIFQKQFSVSYLFYDENKGFKVGGLSPILAYKKKYHLQYDSDVNDYQALQPPENNTTGSSYGFRNNFNVSSRIDVWQIGIVILSMASLTLPAEFISLAAIEDKLNLVSFQYGEMLGSLIRNMLIRNPIERFTLVDVASAAQSLLPMKLEYLKYEDKTERIQITSLSQQHLEQLDKTFKEKKKRKYIIQMTISEPVVQQKFLFYLERIKRENVIQLHINLSPQQIPDDLIEKVMAIIIEYKHLQQLVFNLRGCSISEIACLNIINQANIISQLKQLTLEINGIQIAQIPETIIRVVVYNQ
ncbi:unnamed protein product (macronuclear) [Paramecium tetraurelia]|uniref:Protein kinase domain-containing protein n=1 Tax=Paramecium tetraurelia TaxID=5888 RepID=A0C9E8_PARTE|nr:uncharacterized protein GSPATT00006721001 [Paramecium tetraurelia]CAK67415.1 unnamed protein product [Paramecium tetraurelia]|eukprot:XP_001434812.1 hypothetical protein (macronuclear) [Paramecium tetraurelia strain d4-2]